jgi:3-oxoacyl-(acyl-carrier-protein) synthase
MTDTRHHAVVVTGIGLVTALGVGRQAHREQLMTGAIPQKVSDSERFAPYTVYPLPEIDWSATDSPPRRSAPDGKLAAAGRLCSRPCAR